MPGHVQPAVVWVGALPPKSEDEGLDHFAMPSRSQRRHEIGLPAQYQRRHLLGVEWIPTQVRNQPDRDALIVAVPLGSGGQILPVDPTRSQPNLAGAQSNSLVIDGRPLRGEHAWSIFLQLIRKLVRPPADADLRQCQFS